MREIYVYIYIYICIWHIHIAYDIHIERVWSIGRGHDTVGHPRRAHNLSVRAFRVRISQFELFELILF